MKTKHLFAAACAAAALGFGLDSAFAGGEGWTHDYAAAKKQAATEKKDLLLDFTGSDWCPPCMALSSKILSTEEFRTLTKDKFVLVELDFPKDKSKLDEETAKQNGELQVKYAIEGYPTIFLCDAAGRPYAKTGFRPDEPKEYVAHLDELRGKKESFDKALAEAGKKEGEEKAKALIAVLDNLEMGEMAIAEFYGDVVSQIKAADPKDETGYAKKVDAAKKFAVFDKALRAFHEAEEPDWEAAMKMVEKTLEENTFEGEKKQMVLLAKVSILAVTNKFDEAIKVVDEARAAAPGSQLAKQMDGFKKRLEDAKNAPKEEDEKKDGE